MQRQIKACTHCRQHKVRCDASVCFPKPCSRCVKFSLQCNVDQNFKPRKGGQVELLREHLAKMQEQLDHFNNGAAGRPSTPPPAIGEVPRKKAKVDAAPAAKAPEPLDDDQEEDVQQIKANVAERMAAGGRIEPAQGPFYLEAVSIDSAKSAELHDRFISDFWPYIPIFESNSAGELYARSELLFWAVMTTAALSEPTSELYLSFVEPLKRLVARKCLLETTRSSSVVQALLVLSSWPLPAEKMLEDATPRYLSLAHSMALQLGMHRGKFIYEFSRNQQLMPNAVKWRSRTWVSLFISHKLTSASYGLPASMPVDFIIDHVARGERTYELPRRIVALVRLTTFYSKMMAIMGGNLQSEDGLADPNSRCPLLLILRADLDALFKPDIDFQDPVIHIGYLYMRCTLDSFAFLPETPMTQQSEFITDAHQTCTRIVTVVRKLVGERRIMEFPALIRQATSFSALLLFRLQLLPQLPEQYVSSARESVVTIHRLFRNISSSWLEPYVSNDISRIAKILESLNHVVITRPEMLSSRRIMKHMRSHLTFSLFYELVYIIHEARRRNTRQANGSDGPDPKTTTIQGNARAVRAIQDRPETPDSGEQSPTSSIEASQDSISPLNSGMHSMIQGQEIARMRSMHPLPLFNKISSDSYFSSTVVSPNGTTLTTLVPAESSGPQANQTPMNGEGAHSQVPAAAMLPRESTATASRGRESATSARGNGSKAAPTDPAAALPFMQPPSVEYPGFAGTNGMQNVNVDDSVDFNQILEGLDWMNTEGDDFLGWMLPRNE